VVHILPSNIYSGNTIYEVLSVTPLDIQPIFDMKAYAFQASVLESPVSNA